ncbi:MAG: hypothetical protein C0598_12720 [Marinilabiliales bacterium]|nr:MAG: hypothetical protein C0598_12720 [Marinilabiliales bacterium]
MKRFKFIFLLLFLLTFGIKTVNSQISDLINRSEVHGSFEIDGQYYQADNALGITDSLLGGRKLGLNGFGNITYTLGKFSAGMRYEAYLTPIAGFDPALEGNGFPYLWAAYNDDNFSVTVGNFYEQFGSGFVLRTYEEWALGYDNSLNGVRVTYEPVKGLLFKAVYGTQRYFWDKFEKNDLGIVRGVDAEMNFNDLFKAMSNSKFRFVLGGSMVSKFQVDENPIYKLPENVASFAGRANIGYGKFNLSTEYAYKINDPSAINNYIYKEGQAFIASASYSTKGLGIFAQFKRIDNFSFRSDRDVTANALDISYLPPITESHTYALTSMYPYATQPNGEIGFQFQVNYKVPKKSKLGGKYGMGIEINYSQINDIVRNKVNDTTAINQKGTLGYTSDFLKFGDQIFWRDLHITINKKFSRKVKGIFQYMYQTYDIATIEGHPGEPEVNSHIAVADVTYKFTSTKSLRMEVQGLWTKEDMGDWAAVLLEYTISPHWFFSITDQYNYGNSVVADQTHYFSAAFGYTYKTTRFQFTYGRQREGIVCVGGVCRQVPAASGLSFAISTNF